jgi:hypothetical protein
MHSYPCSVAWFKFQSKQKLREQLHQGHSSGPTWPTIVEEAKIELSLALSWKMELTWLINERTRTFSRQ